MDKKWIELLERVDYAFQPIVDIYTGKTFGVEALIREYSSEKFPTIDSVFDTSYSENILYKLDILLRKKAIEKFSKIEFANNIKLFYNLDNRITSMPDFIPGKTIDIANKLGLKKSNICFELSEKHQAGAYAGIDHLVLNIYKQQGYKMAIDDYGVGFSGLQMLYRSEPDFIKIDRFFISDIYKNKKKKLFVSSIVEMFQAMGIQVIAEGVENKEEYEECKRLGCDMIQGYFVAKPTQNLQKLKSKYKDILKLSLQNRRDSKKILDIENYLENTPSLKENSSIDDVFEYFKANLKTPTIPILCENRYPIGIIKEIDLKQYTYSQFGHSILKNQTKGQIKKIVKTCGVADINNSLEKMLKIYSYNSDDGMIIITKNGKYSGSLNAKAIINMVNEKSLLDAKDQNALTGLSGNRIINEYISERLSSQSRCIMVYFDFDNFKPFNDYYGFRKGDRVILLFADLLKKSSMLRDSLVGHIGGDDFFLGWSEPDETDEEVYEKVKKIVDDFSSDVESFYDEKDRNRGFIKAKSRDGEVRKFRLLTVSAAIIVIKSGTKAQEDVLTQELTRLKKSAKMMSSHIAWSTLYSPRDPSR